MTSEATVLQYNKQSPSDVRLRKLAEFLGVRCKTLDASRLDAEFEQTPNHGLCILVSAGTISAWGHDSTKQRTAINRLRQKSRFLFVYGFAPDNNTTSIAASLSDGQISNLRRFDRDDFDYEVACSHPHFTREFSGLSFGPMQSQIDFGFVCSSSSGGLCSLVSIAGLPFLAALEKDGCTTFLLACKDIVDIQEKTDGNIDVASYFSRLLPPAMFLKSVFKNHCWRTRQRFANFIIDDPLLKYTYGYLNYKDLVAMMDKSDFATTIAFIPWNYKRTESAIAKLFRERSERLSLCVHGCDHTNAEFASTDVGALNCKVRIASNRMNAHRDSTGLAHSQVMVFPQGRFSPEALKVLKCNNYLAAVNSSAMPTPAGECDLCVGDFLDLAITRYAGFSLFLRRYPGRLEGFAFDLFFGKPLLVVEHHAYLKDGGRNLVEFIAQLNSFGGLQWKGLNEIFPKTYLEREMSAHTTECRLYVNHHVIDNHDAWDRTFIMSKPHVDDAPIENVFLNDKTADFVIAGNSIEFAVTIPAQTSTKVDIVYKNVFPCNEPQRDFETASRVWVRRILSEFRDNFSLQF